MLAISANMSAHYIPAWDWKISSVFEAMVFDVIWPSFLRCVKVGLEAVLICLVCPPCDQRSANATTLVSLVDA
jgi:hypothetical protein